MKGVRRALAPIAVVAAGCAVCCAPLLLPLIAVASTATLLYLASGAAAALLAVVGFVAYRAMQETPRCGPACDGADGGERTCRSCGGNRA